MYSYGLVRFLQAKDLKSKEAINGFLQHEGITEFTARNSYKCSEYIQNNWLKFATYVDKGLKNGTLSGKAVKLNTYFDEQKQDHLARRAEYQEFTRDETRLIEAIRNYDDMVRFSRVSSYLGKTYGYNELPKNQEATSRAKKVLPKIQYIINNGWLEEVITHLRTFPKNERWS